MARAYPRTHDTRKREKSKRTATSIYICLNVKKYRAVEATSDVQAHTESEPERTFLLVQKLFSAALAAVHYGRGSSDLFIDEIGFSRDLFIVFDTKIQLNAASNAIRIFAAKNDFSFKFYLKNRFSRRISTNANRKKVNK